MEIMKWLRRERCAWDASACTGAAKGGHLEVLKWLRSEGCPWDWRAWRSAAESTREWLEENGCPQGPVNDPYYDVYREYDSEDGEYW